jgi:hypothetical protein
LCAAKNRPKFPDSSDTAAMRRKLLTLAIFVIALAAPVSAVMAQAHQPAELSGWDRFVDRLDTEMMAVILVFGTGIVAVLSYMIPATIRACRGVSDCEAELTQRIVQLEQRVANLESRLPR